MAEAPAQAHQVNPTRLSLAADPCQAPLRGSGEVPPPQALASLQASLEAPRLAARFCSPLFTLNWNG